MGNSFRVGLPIVQSMGMQGEHLMLKVSFVVDEVSGGPDKPHEETVRNAGTRSIILQMKAEDLPMIAPRDATPHFDVGRRIQEEWNS